MSSSTPATREQVISLYSKFRKPDVPDVTPQELWKRIQEKDPNLVLVDVRDAAEQMVSVLPGPTLTKSEFDTDPFKYKDYKVVCYCTAGLRSGNCARDLRSKGFDAANLEGSILGWTHEKLPLVVLENREVETNKLHVYAKQFALQAEGYEAVWYSTPRTIYGVVGGALDSFFRGMGRWFWRGSQQSK